MKCAWQEYINLLPVWMRADVDRQGRDLLQELRLRIGRPPELVIPSGNLWLNRSVSAEDLSCCMNAASRYSPWASTSIKHGYITAAGGHRLGVCGDVTIIDGKISTITNVTSLCIRVARDFSGLGLRFERIAGSILIIGPPGSGKTTLLRDIIRQKSNGGHGPIAVVDERKELFPTIGNSFCFSPGISTEVMSGCRKNEGMDIMIRTMTPRWIAVDEITAEADTNALVHAGWCGVSLLATAHAENLKDLKCRPIYQPLIKSGLLEYVIVMGLDKSWTLERMSICK